MKYVIENGIVIMETSIGQKILLDEIDKDLAGIEWRLDKQETSTRDYYYAMAPNSRGKLHRVIMGRIEGRKLKKEEVVDHINRNGLDNRRCNLRIATISQNNANRSKSAIINGKSTTSKYKGVSFNKGKQMWRARISFNGKDKELGYFKTEEEAKGKYDENAKEIFGDFAYFN
jgi:hypothetical protein